LSFSNDFPKIRNLPKIFLSSFTNVSPVLHSLLISPTMPCESMSHRGATFWPVNVAVASVSEWDGICWW